MRLFQRFLGRVNMCLNTAARHDDEAVRDANRIRATAYMNALDDLQKDEELKLLVKITDEVLALKSEGLLRAPRFQPLLDYLAEVHKIWRSQA